MSKKQGYICRVSKFLEDNPDSSKEEIRAAFKAEMKGQDNSVYQLASKFFKLFDAAACEGYSHEYRGNDIVKTATKLTDEEVEAVENRAEWLKKVARLFNESARLDGSGAGAKKFNMMDHI